MGAGDRGGPVRGDVPGGSAGGDLAQHGVQPAGGLGAQTGQLAVAAAPRPAARPRGHRPGPGGRPATAARPPRPGRRRPGHSCPACRRTAAGPGRPAWAGHPAPARRPRRAASPARDPGPPRPPAAQVRSGHSAAQPASLEACRDDARTVSSPSRAPAASIATAVWDALRGSAPIITDVINSPSARWYRVTGTGKGMTEPRRACLISGRQTAGPFPGHATAGSGDWPLVIKPDRGNGRQSHREPATGIPANYGKNPAVPTRHTIRALGERARLRRRSPCVTGLLP
jgi:hypothetical protein